MKYQLVFVLKGSSTEEEKNKILEEVKKLLTENKAEAGELEDLGKKKLAFPVGKETEAYYFVYNFVTEADTLPKLNVKFKLFGKFLRYFAVKQQEVKFSKKKKISAEKKEREVVSVTASEPVKAKKASKR